MTSMGMLLLRHVRNERELTRARDGRLQLALVCRAGARNAPGLHLAALGDEAHELPHVLVVDVIDALRAELADTAAARERPASLALALVVLLVAAAAAASASFFPHRMSSIPPSPSMSSLSPRRSLGSGSGGRPRATRRRAESALRCAVARFATSTSSSMRTMR